MAQHASTRLLCLAFGFLANVAIAQTNVEPAPFVTPIELDRGQVIPGSQQSFVLSDEDSCAVVQLDWGWETCDGIEGFVLFHVPGVQATLIKTPNRDGYVDLSDWSSAARDATVTEIERDLTAGAQLAAAQLGRPVSFDGWVVEPTLNAEEGYLYYATRIVWDGQPTINIDASLFDRRGYIPFQIIPQAPDVSEAEVQALIDATFDLFVTEVAEVYEAFEDGDRVSTVGAVGVLSRLAGIAEEGLDPESAIDQAAAFIAEFWYGLLGGLVLLLFLFGWAVRRRGPAD